MKIAITTEIDVPIADLWRIVADDFTSIQQWSDSVVTSEAIDGAGASGAPIGGRYCTFTDDPKGFAAREVITEYDRDHHRLAFDVEPVHPPKALPMVRNHVVITLERMAAGRTRLHWVANVELKPFGYVLYPVVRAAVRKSFRGIVAELKQFAESDAAPAAAA